ncbi:unnamed protein product [Gongylonema pulchrum]|uniref:SSD domain-containing protein n=1 Tax=Gongylonema pulchrum TaxID=637853 RepID=A0A183EZZ3_9BILA|nr:unnamed protein product [Gongylonema pulchrum]
MFITVAAWHKAEKIYPGSDHGTLKARMVDAMSESAVAIFITSFTDVLSFAIGCFTDIIAVRGFCAMTSACMFFTFLYQVPCNFSKFLKNCERSGKNEMSLKQCDECLILHDVI